MTTHDRPAASEKEFEHLQQRLAVLERERDHLQARVQHLQAQAYAITDNHLSTEQQTFQAMVELAPDAIISVVGPRITYANPACRALFGYSDEVWPTVTLADLHAEASQQHIPIIVAHLEEQQLWRGELTYQRQDGSTFIGQVAIFALDRTGLGGTGVHVGIIRDVSSQREQARQLQLFAALAEHALDGISVAQLDGMMVYANPAFQQMSGFGEQVIGMSFLDLYTPEAQVRVHSESTPSVLQQGRWQGELEARRPDGQPWVAQMSAVLLASEGQAPQLAAIFRDVTAQKQAEAERAMLHEQVIMAQQAALRELSTPLIPLADEVVVMPLVGTIDSARAQQIMETLLEGVAAHQASTVLLDISGVKVVDTQVAQALLRAAKAVKLLGARVVLTGISPEVAQTMVHLGADLGDISTQANLQAGLRLAMGQERLDGRPGAVRWQR